MSAHVEEMILRLRDQFTKVMGDAERKTVKTRKATAALDKRVGSLQKTALRAFGAFSAAVMIKQVGQAGIEMEQTRVAFKTFIGDAETANKVLADLNEFSNVTPFTNNEVIQAGRSLLAFGSNTKTVMPQIKAIGDLAAGTGKNFNELATMYGKAQVSGTLYADDINRLLEAGVPVIDEFSKSLGVPKEQVKKLASQGKIGFAQLEDAFKSLTSEGGQFYNLMSAQSKTVGGRISTLRGQLQTVSIAIGEAMLPAIGAITDKISMFTGWLSKNKDTIASWIPIIFRVIGTIGALIAVVKAYTIVQGILNVVMTANPIGLIVMAIGALIGVIVVWRDKIKEAITSNSTLGRILRIVFSPVIMIYKAFKWLNDAVKDWFKTSETGQKVTKAWTVIMWAMGQAVKKVGEFFTDLPNKAISAFTAIRQKVKGFVDSVRGAVKVITNPFDKKEQMKGILMMSDGAKAASESIGDIYNRTYRERKEKQAADEKRINDELAAKAASENGGADGSLPNGLGGVGINSGGGSLSANTSAVSSAGAGKNITININKLIEGMTISTTNLKQGSAEIRDIVTKALLTAVNDTQAAI